MHITHTTVVVWSCNLDTLWSIMYDTIMWIFMKLMWNTSATTPHKSETLLMSVFRELMTLTLYYLYHVNWSDYHWQNTTWKKIKLSWTSYTFIWFDIDRMSTENNYAFTASLFMVHYLVICELSDIILILPHLLSIWQVKSY